MANKNEYFGYLYAIIAIIELFILIYSSGIIGELERENKILEINNSNLKIQNEYIKEVNNILIENKKLKESIKMVYDEYLKKCVNDE